MLFSCKSMLSSRSRGKNNRSPLWSLGKFSTMCCWLPFNRKRNSIKSLMAIENLRCTLCRIRQAQDHLFCKRFWGQDTSVKHGALFGLYGIPLSHCSVARALAYSQEGQDPQSRTKNLVQASCWYEKYWKILKTSFKKKPGILWFVSTVAEGRSCTRQKHLRSRGDCTNSRDQEQLHNAIRSGTKRWEHLVMPRETRNTQTWLKELSMLKRYWVTKHPR